MLLHKSKAKPGKVGINGDNFAFAKKNKAFDGEKWVEFVKEFYYPGEDDSFPQYEEDGIKYWWSPFGFKVEVAEHHLVTTETYLTEEELAEIRTQPDEDDIMLRELRDSMEEENTKNQEDNYRQSVLDIAKPSPRKRYFCERSGPPPKRRNQDVQVHGVSFVRVNATEIAVQTNLSVFARRTGIPRCGCGKGECAECVLSFTQ